VSKAAIITGVSGQDGSYLAELLIRQGVRVRAYLRPKSKGLGSASHLIGRMATRSFPVDSQAHWDAWIKEEQPDELYHLAASSFIPDSWNDPVATNASNFDWTTRLFEAVRRHSPATRVLIASSSAIFGNPSVTPQNESTPTTPISPYGVTKAAADWMVNAYRQQYGLYLCSAILYNHESPRRPPQFVTRKISQAVAAIHAGRQHKLVLGNLDVSRDWGFAGDYVDAMHRMLQLDQPENFVIGSGRLERLRKLVEIAFETVGLDYRNYVESDPGLVRSNDTNALVADSSKAQKLLDWTATTKMPELIAMMVQADVDALKGLKKVA
jgi:GDPmannose 4,6-dehydratase